MYLGEYIDLFEDGQTYICNLRQDGYTGGFNIAYNDNRHDYLSTVTVDKSTMISIRVYIQVPQNVTKNETIYPIVNKGEKLLSFEPYTGGKRSPNPDYPQEIISKGFNIQKSLNLFDKSKVEKLKTINADGSVADNGSSNVSGYISVKPNTTYSMTGTKQTRGKFYTSDKKGIGTDYNFNPYNDTTFKTDANTYFIQFCLSASNDGSNVILNEGYPLSPYEDFSEIKLYGTNLLDPNVSTNKFVPLKLKKGTIVTCIGKDGVVSQGGNILCIDADEQNYWIGYDAGNHKQKYTLFKDVIGFYQKLVGDVSNYCFAIGDIDDYEPYKEQTITFPDPITLRGIPVTSGGNVTIDGQQYIADVICEKDGVVGVERNVLNETYKGSSDEAWSLQSINSNGIANFQIKFKQSVLKQKHILSDRFEYLNKNISNATKEDIYYTEEVCFLRFKNERISTVEALKSWLSENNVEVVAPLKEPTFEHLPEEIQTQYKALKSYYPNTVIQTGAFNEVEYVADTKKYIDKKLVGITELALGGK